jgi:glucose-6-phosphate isomerase
MFPNISPVETTAWKKLQADQQFMKGIQMRNLFSEDRERFNRYSIIFGDILFDFSKNLINAETFSHLFELASECQVGTAINAMFSGEKINQTENRSVLHTALRNFSGEPVYSDGNDVMPDVMHELEHMKGFCQKIHSGEWRGYSGKPIRNIVNIGIGGSDLGPVMVTEALKHYWIDGMQAFFVSNVDATHIVETLKKINPEETLFLIASKTFTTQETMTNAFSAREWFPVNQ